MGELKYFFLDLIFPRRCLGCAELLADLSDAQLCAVCPTTIKLKTDFACAFCSAPVLVGQTCSFCRPDHSLDYLLVTTSYETPLVEKLLKTLKYKFVRSLADPAASLMIKYLEKFMAKGTMGRVWLNAQATSALGRPLVVPVPLHRRRLHWRGFYQSELIAERVSRHFGWPLVNALERKRNNRPQAEITDRLARIENLSGSFFCPRPELVSGKVVLLIDDVSTTGSTLDDCARALKTPANPELIGAQLVIGFVFARGK